MDQSGSSQETTVELDICGDELYILLKDGSCGILDRELVRVRRDSNCSRLFLDLPAALVRIFFCANCSSFFFFERSQLL